MLNPSAGNMLLSINAYDIREIELAFRDLVLRNMMLIIFCTRLYVCACVHVLHLLRDGTAV